MHARIRGGEGQYLDLFSRSEANLQQVTIYVVSDLPPVLDDPVNNKSQHII